jgi:hypothetical protein
MKTPLLSPTLSSLRREEREESGRRFYRNIP